MFCCKIEETCTGTSDAPRRWWNILDKALRSYGLIPTRDAQASLGTLDKRSHRTAERHKRRLH